MCAMAAASRDDIREAVTIDITSRNANAILRCQTEGPEFRDHDAVHAAKDANHREHTGIRADNDVGHAIGVDVTGCYINTAAKRRVKCEKSANR